MEILAKALWSNLSLVHPPSKDGGNLWANFSFSTDFRDVTIDKAISQKSIEKINCHRL